MYKFKILFIGLLIAGAAIASTNIPGGDVAGTWDLAGSPYIVNGDITVPSGEDLTLEPGVEVLFNGNVALFVNGTMHAIGTEIDSIKFLRTEPTGPGWEGIRFWEAYPGSEIAYALIAKGNSSGGTYPDNYGGGVFIRSTNNVSIHHCTFRDNVASFGGAIYTAVSNVEIHHNVFENNQAGSFGSAISMLGDGAHIRNNTFINNSNPVVHFELSDEGTVFENNIVDGGSFYFQSSNDAIVKYNDLPLVQLIGEKPLGLGTVTTTNANGDPSDIYYNIFLNPLFMNAATGDYHLRENSPAIDAGNPASMLDPDGTIADIGAFYYNQNGLPMVDIILIPANPPITIPASGGTFDFNIELMNNGSESITFDVWTMAELPNGSMYGPIIGPVTLTLNNGVSIDRDRSQNVPAGAPSGNYTYYGYVGVYPNTIWESDSFEFSKTETGDGLFVNNWDNTGESFNLPENDTGTETPAEFGLSGAYPNPFNPTTTLSFALSEAGYATLIVYDIAGREVATVENGFLQAGFHSRSFNASELASGVYFARLQVAGQAQTQKLILLK